MNLHLPIAISLSISTATALPASDFTFEPKEDRIVVRLGEDLFTEYRFRERRPCLFPVFGPGGQQMTRRWPLAPDPDHPESQDHPHHTGIWFAHGHVRVAGEDRVSDFWHLDRIEHQGFIAYDTNIQQNTLVTRHGWKHRNGTPVCTDRTRISFGQSERARWIDWEIEIQPPNGRDLILGDTKEGTMAVRMREELALATANKKLNHLAQGHITTSEGDKGTSAWGKRARWCAYHGQLDGQPAVIAIFDHPANPRHPTWWMARDYGLFAANAFGQHHFENAPEGHGDFTIPAGTSVTFRYRFLFLGEEFDRGKMEAEYLRYTSP